MQIDKKKDSVVRLVLLLVFALSAAACAGTTRMKSPAGEVTIGAFVYQAPGEGWQATLYPPSAAGLVHHYYRRDGDRLQFQLSEITPVRPVPNEAALLAWAAQAGGGSAELAGNHNATCASYAHRWRQTLSLGGPAQPWATIEERGLFCIDPGAQDRLLQVRVLERLPPEAPASSEFEPIAAKLLAGFRARGRN